MTPARILSWIIAAFLVLAPVAFPVVAVAEITPESTGLTQAAGQAGLNNACGADTKACLAQIVGSVIKIALGFVEVLLFIYLLYGGFLWMTSGGNEEGVKKAKVMIRNAVIGLVIITMSYVVTSYIVTQLSTL
ncbi:MAG: hypothetical protein Q7N87_00515 [Candidatus Uhrbacteria bacterium]|nr:hypothetical protein [Candidatus Uhrbacteria bacterium]